MNTVDTLIDAALVARKNAHAPFSKFKVGAAIEDESGRIFTGCNVENATYGLTMCAERVAVYKGISEGSHRFRRCRSGCRYRSSDASLRLLPADPVGILR